jgi:hypothetical protein
MIIFLYELILSLKKEKRVKVCDKTAKMILVHLYK